MTLTILVVDDEADNAAAIADVLSIHGHRVDTAIDARGAIEHAGRQRYDVALLDYQMPGGNGAELYRRLRTMQPSLPGVMITAHASGGAAEEAAAAGIRRVLDKPVDLPTLIDELGGV